MRNSIKNTFRGTATAVGAPAIAAVNIVDRATEIPKGLGDVISATKNGIVSDFQAARNKPTRFGRHRNYLKASIKAPIRTLEGAVRAAREVTVKPAYALKNIVGNAFSNVGKGIEHIGSSKDPILKYDDLSYTKRATQGRHFTDKWFS